MPSNKNSENNLVESVAKTVINKAAFQTSPYCERALGGKANVIRAANMGLQNSDIMALITANLVVNFCTEKDKTSEQIKAYKEGVSDFVLFLAKCAQELEESNRKQLLEANPDLAATP